RNPAALPSPPPTPRRRSESNPTFKRQSFSRRPSWQWDATIGMEEGIDRRLIRNGYHCKADRLIR
ncbi:hypothetical protein, partial [Novosphingobium arvoryzae]|uniref:hypothetical protein n=1 Tax=Novosphingobium arvoryzae TaxID=1256514 RepID=UPI001E5F5B12